MNFLFINYPKYREENKSWKNSILTFILVLTVFLIFQPFGFEDKDLYIKILLFPEYAFLGFLWSSLNFVFVRYIANKRDKWKVKDEILLLLTSTTLLSTAVHLLTHFAVDDMPLSFIWFLTLFYHVFSIILVVVAFEFYYYINKEQKSNNDKLLEKYKDLKHKHLISTKKEVASISLSFENEQLEINREKIIYIQSNGNYLELYIREPKNEIIKIVKRGRLHKIENDLSQYPEFFRSHRAFIINLNHIVKLKGNSKNAEIVFDNICNRIPVSRTNYSTLKDIIEKITLN